MPILIVLAKVAQAALLVLTEAMFFRAILSLFVDPENKIYLFLSMLTEPLILPARLFCERLNIGQDLPIDIPFFSTYLFLTILAGLMPAI